MKKLFALLKNQRGDVVVTDPPTPAPEVPAELTPETPPEVLTETPPETPPVMVPLAALKDEKKKRQTLAEENAYLKGRLESVAAPAAPVTTPASQEAAPPAKPAKPKAADYEEWSDFEAAEAEYDTALEEYHEKKTQFVVAQTLRTETTRSTQQENQQRAARTFKERLDKATETDPELADIVANYHLQASPHHVPMNNAMTDIILESEVGPDIIRHLANDRKLAGRIAAMPPLQAAKEMGKIEVALATKVVTPPTKVSLAPEPVTTITPSGAVKTFDPETAPMEEYYKARTAELFNRRKK